MEGRDPSLPKTRNQHAYQNYRWHLHPGITRREANLRGVADSEEAKPRVAYRDYSEALRNRPFRWPHPRTDLLRNG